MGYTPEAIANRKLTEASRLRTTMLELETSAERLDAWGGSDVARATLRDSIEGLLVCIVKLESEAHFILSERAKKVANGL